MKFKVVKKPSELTWDELLEVLDEIGMWHYKRSFPNKEDYVRYDVTTNKNESSYFGNSFTLSCPRTEKIFHFCDKWFTTVRGYNPKDLKAPYDDLGNEGKLYSALPFVEFLFTKGYIAIYND